MKIKNILILITALFMFSSCNKKIDIGLQVSIKTLTAKYYFYPDIAVREQIGGGEQLCYAKDQDIELKIMKKRVARINGKWISEYELLVDGRSQGLVAVISNGSSNAHNYRYINDKRK